MDGDRLYSGSYKSVISHCALFKKLSPEVSKSFLDLFHEEVWPKNTCIINHEKLFYHFHIILSGRIKMYQVDPLNGKELTLFLLTESDVFDLFCLLDGCEHNVYYECLDDAKVLAAPMISVRNWLNSNPEHYKNFLP
jgi:CRP/FNR family transcriptional regulator